MHVNLKKLASEIERTTGLRPTAFHAYSEMSDPDIEFSGGYMVQVTDYSPGRPYVFYMENNGVMTQLGDFRTQKDLVEYIRAEIVRK